MRSPHRFALLSLVALVVSAAAPAQDDVGLQLSQALLEDAFVAPIHDGGDTRPDYGVWATGRSYKVSFHGGMRFHPVLGAAASRGWPLGWRTVEVSFGGETVDTKRAPDFVHDDWRAEYRYGGFTEVYDVRPEGVEQTFVIHERPRRIGDLVVRGAIVSDLVADPRQPRHAPLAFRIPNGSDVVSYGEVTAVDARGARFPMLTAFDGESVTLRLGADAVARAAFPLTVDPLLATVLLNSSTAIVDGASVVHSRVGSRLIVVYTRETTAGAFDIYGRVFDTDFQNGVLVFADADEFTSYSNPSVTVVGGSPVRWVAAFEAEILGNPTPFRIAYHVQDVNDLVLDSTVSFLPQNTGTSRRRPSAGGSDEDGGSPIAFIVCEEEGNNAMNANTPSTGIRGVLLNTSTGVTTETLNLVNPAGSIDRESPDLNQKTAGGAEPWVVVWQEQDGSAPGDDWDVRAALCSTTGFVGLDGSEILGETGIAKHNVRPKVDGRLGRYMVTYSTLANSGGPSSAMSSLTLRAHQFDWSVSSPSPTGRAEFLVRSAAVQLKNADLSFDAGTDGHWVNITDALSAGFGGGLFVDRMNKQGMAESAAIAPALQVATPYGITYDSENERQAIVYSEPDEQPLRGVVMTLPAPPFPTFLGSGCGTPTATIGTVGHALAGSRDLFIRMTGGPAMSPVGLFISRGSLSTPLDSIGFPGCNLEVDGGPPYLLTVPGTTDGSGTRAVPFSVPPAMTGLLFFQFAYIIPSMPTPTLGMTNGMQVMFTL
ncbi:MAG: hypothetical protein KDB80_09140 [Planctomycetes bacterium]|nr:hypothetical protein [Planctomycetota bacterium]